MASPPRRAACYAMYEGSWDPRLCPCCQQRIARHHAWLFTDPPPVFPASDTRQAVGEVFEHDEGNDCERWYETTPASEGRGCPGRKRG